MGENNYHTAFTLYLFTSVQKMEHLNRIMQRNLSEEKSFTLWKWMAVTGALMSLVIEELCKQIDNL